MIIKTQQTRDGFFYIGLPSVERKKERIVTFDETRKRVVRRDLLFFFFFPLSSSPPPPVSVYLLMSRNAAKYSHGCRCTVLCGE